MFEPQVNGRLSAAFNYEAFLTSYNKTFSVLKADSVELKERAFGLRHQVFVEENGFADIVPHDEGLEYDRYDYRAVHYVLAHEESGADIGAVRVILPDDEHPEASLPMQAVCDHPMLQDAARVSTLCQISRMCMAANFRKRDRDGALLPAYYEQEDRKGTVDGAMVYIRRRIPYAPLGLFRAAFETALRHRIMDCLMMIEPEQLPYLNRMGISYSVLGPCLEEYRGMRPVVFNIKNVLDTMLIDNPQCWDVISDMGRVHKMANGLYLNDWQDRMMDDLDLEDVLEDL